MYCSMLFCMVSLGWLGVYILIIFLSQWGGQVSTYYVFSGQVSTYCVFLVLYLQVDGMGNCLFSAIRKSLVVHTATAQGPLIFLTGTLGEWWSTI